MKNIITLLLFVCFCQVSFAQVDFYAPYGEVLDSTNATIGYYLFPDGTQAIVTIVSTGSGAATAGHGDYDINNFGGVFTGDHLSAYVGDTTPQDFTRLQGAASDLGNNINANRHANSLGFWMHFDQPVLQPQILAVDLDGNRVLNGEWFASFAYNSNTLIPATYSMKTPGGGSGGRLITHSAKPHPNWNTLIDNTVGASATDISQTAYDVARVNVNAPTGTQISPDDTSNQVMVSYSVAVTDVFFLWGCIGNPSTGTQNSGVSPMNVQLFTDFGDAPESYGTSFDEQGASHGVTSDLKLGSITDIEEDGVASAAADSDSDDDGVASVGTITTTNALSQTVSYSATTTYSNNTTSSADLIAWLDLNNNGTFEASEAQSTSVAAGASGSHTFSWSGVTLSGAAGTDHTFMRIRTSTDGMTINDPTGAFKDGEVEDYRVPFTTALPVEFISFEVQEFGDAIAVLEWSTASELNNEGFEIQRKSINEKEFVSVGFVNGNGTNHSIAKYTFNDDISFTPESVCYRLKQIDFDGKFELSDVRCVKQEEFTEALSIYPNPTRATITIETSREIESYITITDGYGKVYSDTKTHNAREIVDLSDYADGVYFLKVNDRVSKVIKY